MAHKIRNRKWKWLDPLYDVQYFLYTGTYAGFAEWINEIKEDEKFLDPSYRALGQTVWFHTEQPRKSAIGLYLNDHVDMRNPGHINTVVHEALHAVFCVMDSRGIALHKESDEAFTYYLGWLVEEMTRRLMK